MHRKKNRWKVIETLCQRAELRKTTMATEYDEKPRENVIRTASSLTLLSTAQHYHCTMQFQNDVFRVQQVAVHKQLQNRCTKTLRKNKVCQE